MLAVQLDNGSKTIALRKERGRIDTATYECPIIGFPIRSIESLLQVKQLDVANIINLISWEGATKASLVSIDIRDLYEVR